MDDRVARIASIANVQAYNSHMVQKYVDGAPHVKHASLRALYSRILIQVFDNAVRYSSIPRVLDLGAGEGSVTRSFLELGASVVAVDISEYQLNELKDKCKHYGERLEIYCDDVNSALENLEGKFDVVVANSFLHHVPDYISFIKSSVSVLGEHGQFFSFQDPLKYRSLSHWERLFSDFAYLSWRVFRGDIMGGVARRLRRKKGIYLDDSVEDNSEYHVVRGGVDQDAIWGVLDGEGFDCDVISYFSTQSRVFQPVGTILGVKNTFSVVAVK
ncbi:MAG: hypothetical protein CMK89_08215 [Pseudomonadales bacterium]|nr:hypothetical protein [Pseudomonadales bacterium]